MASASHTNASRQLKDEVREFWDQVACGEVYAKGASLLEQLESQAKARYQLEPYILDFARFAGAAGRDVLEIGVGMGADHAQWARAAPRSLAGMDLSERAVDFTRKRLELHGLASHLLAGDAENLPFPSGSFDLVYSWGVLHHSPDTHRGIEEVWRVLRPGGEARIMIYHAHSVVGYMLWVRYGLLAGAPGSKLTEIYARHLESPGTKAFLPAEARRMFSRFSSIEVRSKLSFGDLLEGEVGQRHRGLILTMAKTLWPRWLIRRFLTDHGLLLLIEAVK